MKHVIYTVPDSDMTEVLIKISVEEAILNQKCAAGEYGYVYESDEEALEDFISIHWAQVIEE